MRDRVYFINPDLVLDNPQKVTLETADQEELQRHLEGYGFAQVNIWRNEASAIVSQLEADSGELYHTVNQWFQIKYPFCPEFIHDMTEEDLTGYINDNRGGMTDEEILEWIPQIPGFSSGDVTFIDKNEWEGEIPTHIILNNEECRTLTKYLTSLGFLNVRVEPNRVKAVIPSELECANDFKAIAQKWYMKTVLRVEV